MTAGTVGGCFRCGGSGQGAGCACACEGAAAAGGSGLGSGTAGPAELDAPPSFDPEDPPGGRGRCGRSCPGRRQRRLQHQDQRAPGAWRELLEEGRQVLTFLQRRQDHREGRLEVCRRVRHGSAGRRCYRRPGHRKSDVEPGQLEPKWLRNQLQCTGLLPMQQLLQKMCKYKRRLAVKTARSEPSRPGVEGSHYFT